MKILHVNTSDRGGAANACVRLHLGLLEQGMDSRLLVRSSYKGIEGSTAFTPRPKPQPVPTLRDKVEGKLHRLAVELRLARPRPAIDPAIAAERERRSAFLASRPKGLDWFSYPDSGLDITDSETYRQADIIHLHWVADFLDWELFFSKNTKPVVWTLHDQNPFLGGQHYAERYLGMDGSGRPVPRQLTAAEVEEDRRIAEVKQHALANVSDLHVVAPSLWLHQEAKASKLLGRFRHYHAPNHFPAEVFRPLDRSVCRDILGLPADKLVLLFVAESTGVNRKGFAYLLQAFSQLPAHLSGDMVLCSIGRQSALDTPFEVVELGHVQDERLMAVAYAAADVFVIPSLEDNLPNTMTESILCGTPVIGFPTGGIVDVIGADKGNGLLCPGISVASLRDTLESFLLSPAQFDRFAIARDAADRYSGDAVTSQYMDVYKAALNTKQNGHH